MDTYIGWPGKVHDAKVFSNSSKCHKGREGTLFPGWNGEINRVQVHIYKIYNYVLVQTCNFIQVCLFTFIDPAYSLLPWLMKPYAVTPRTIVMQKRYNYLQSRARMVVENAFSRLKASVLYQMASLSLLKYCIKSP